MALYALLKNSDFEIVSLVTTINYNGKVFTHGITSGLLKKQAEALGIPLLTVALPSLPTHEEKNRALKQIFQKFKQQGINHMALTLTNDHKARENWEILLHQFSMKGIFPLWQKSSHDLLQAFLELGFKAVVTSVCPKALDRSFTGREINTEFAGSLPKTLNTNSETGDFRSFVYDGPIFSQPVSFKRGIIMLRDGFYFCDLMEK